VGWQTIVFWGGFFGTSRANFGRPDAPNTPYRKVIIQEKEDSNNSIGQNTILMFSGIGILAWTAMRQSLTFNR
jgi:hypothetical protein